jgi:hypothetical protein
MNLAQVKMAVFLLVNQGALASGSAFWGALASRHGLHKALIWAGVEALATMILGFFFALPDVDSDVTPWIHWKLSADLVDQFLHAVRGYSRIRRRDGFLTASWGEHLRQHVRATQADRAIEEAVLNSILGRPGSVTLSAQKTHR